MYSLTDTGDSLGLDYANNVIFAEPLLSFGQFKFGVFAKHKVPMRPVSN